jgi:sugar phosphate permease
MPLSVLAALVGFFRERPAAPRLTDPARIAREYRRWRARMLFGSTAGYGLYYFTRKNISVALPLLGARGHSNSTLGLIGSLHYVAYAVGKLGFGLLADRVDPRRFMTVGLALSGLCCLGFGLSSSALAFGLFWCWNGVFQSTGVPCAKICTRWFSVSERGTKWAIWNISHQAGGGAVLVLAGQLATRFGWRGTFIGPALIALGGAIFCAVILRDRPEAMGLPPVDVYRNDPEVPAAAGAAVEPARSFGRLLVERVLLNPRLLLLALGSMCVYVVRFGTLDWAPKYLVEVKHHAIDQAGWVSSLIEFVGVPGMLLAGWISDRFFAARRAPISVVYLLLLGLATYGFHRVPVGHAWLDAAAVGAIGFFTYGPQMLLAGVGAADVCGAEVAAAAVGVTGLMSYVGAMLSSLLTGRLIDSHGWGAAFALWIGCALLGALLVAPLWRSRGRRR